MMAAGSFMARRRTAGGMARFLPNSANGTTRVANVQAAQTGTVISFVSLGFFIQSDTVTKVDATIGRIFSAERKV